MKLKRYFIVGPSGKMILVTRSTFLNQGRLSLRRSYFRSSLPDSVNVERSPNHPQVLVRGVSKHRGGFRR